MSRIINIIMSLESGKFSSKVIFYILNAEVSALDLTLIREIS